MKCPKCEAELRPSKKDPVYGLCDNCKKKFKLPNKNPASAETKEGSDDLQKYSNIPPKHVRRARESEMKKNYSDMLSINEDAGTSISVDESDTSASKSPKKKGVIIVILLLVLLLVAGGGIYCYKTGIASSLINKVMTATGMSAGNGAGKSLTYKADKFELTYTDHALAKDYEGNECLVVYFDFKNTGENATNAGYEVNIAASQNETACEATSLETFDEAVDRIYLDVTPDSSSKIGKAFKLTDKSDVTLEVSDLLGLSDALSSQTLTLK